jgi:hypothetical protein
MKRNHTHYSDLKSHKQKKHPENCQIFQRGSNWALAGSHELATGNWRVKQMKNNKLCEQVRVSAHRTGKMAGFVSISTSTVDNDFCAKMAANPNCVCAKCYARKYECYRPRLRHAMVQNGQLLSSGLLADEQIPQLNALAVRIHAFGEIINDTHVRNIYAICNKNKRVLFVIWTKRPNMLSADRPSNLRVIVSNPKIDSIVKYDPKCGFDAVFNVVSATYAEKNGIRVNCGGKSCKDCMNCYADEIQERTIIEVLK